MSGFDKYWNDLQKHQKRVGHWLPHWKGLAERIRGGRHFRYFTLCARSMVDVFMLVKEEVLRVEPANNSIGRVQFCEREWEQFIEIREMIGREDAGFFGSLEEVTLFQDDGFTGQFPTPESIESGLDDLGRGEEEVDRLQLKRAFFNLRSSFPYDCINLDFCEYYYEPPDMLRVNRAVAQFFEWQRRPSEDGEEVEVEEFILTVTCRYDAAFPPPAEEHLVRLIRSNCARSREYRDELRRTRGTTRPEEWARENREDLFLAGWPKDIALSAKQNGWSMDILDYVYYRRDGHRGPFVIACLVSKFTLARGDEGEIRAALLALDRDKRSLIREIDRASVQGQGLLESLTGIVAVHNEHAVRRQRPKLPDP